MNNVDECLQYKIEHEQDIEKIAEMKEWLRGLTRTLERGEPSVRSSLDGNADIWVHCHTLPEIHLSAKDIAQLPHSGTVKLVLLLRPLTSHSIDRSAPDRAVSPDGRIRFLAVDPVPGIFYELWKLVKWAGDERQRRFLPGGEVAT
jgi:hypothetical protein